MPSTTTNPSPKVSVSITDPGGKVIAVVSNSGDSALPPSAGQPLTVAKTAAAQVIHVHGTVAGVVFDNDLGK